MPLPMPGERGKRQSTFNLTANSPHYSTIILADSDILQGAFAGDLRVPAHGDVGRIGFRGPLCSRVHYNLQ